MKGELTTDLKKSIAEIKRRSGGSSDIIINEFEAGGVSCAFVCCDGTFSSQAAAELVFAPITELPPRGGSGELFRYIRERRLLSADRSEISDYEGLFAAVYSGFAVLLAEGEPSALGFGVQGFAVRSVQEPSGENNIMGAHEGFSEALRTSLSQIRRRMKTPELVMEISQLGSKSRTDICVCYMKDRVPKRLIERIRRSLGRIELEAVLTTGHVRPFVESGRFELFSSTGVTERPDVLCSKLIEGRVAILIDGVPFAIIVPRLFCESFQTLDDYAFKPYYAAFIRWIKYAAFAIATLLPAVYVAIAAYHPELLNSTLLMILVESEKKAPLSIITEAAGVLIAYEIVREAGIRLPKPMGGAVSLVSGLIIGDAAVKSGLISTPLLTVTALAVMSGLCVPDLNAPVTVLRFAFLAAGGFMGLFGISLLACAALVNVCATEDYGFPYTAPLSPLSRRGVSDSLYRAGMRKMQSRGFTVEEYYE